MLTSSDGMIEKGKFMKAIFLCVLLMIISFNPFWVEATRASLTDTHQFLPVNDDISISYTNSSFTIKSVSQYGNFSFIFGWINTRTYIIYNGIRREMRKLEIISFTDETAGYTMEYCAPVKLFEYIDIDGNNILSDTENANPDILIGQYKIIENIEATNVTISEDANGIPVYEWTFTLLACPAGSAQEPWERYPTVEEKFHYYPLNGTLKMDIILQNYRNPRSNYIIPENASSRLFLSYGMRYVPLEQNNVTVTASFDNQELVYDQIDMAYPTNSNVITFKVDGVKRGFFDFGGKVTIDNNPNLHVNGSIGPTRSYYYYYKPTGRWLEIGLNYPHVNQTMIHDPYFGLYLSTRPSPIATIFPFEWAIATAVASVIICTVAIVDYFRTRSRYFKYAIRPLT